MIIVVNKWDTLEKDSHTMKNWEEDIRERFNTCPYAPIIFCISFDQKTASPQVA